MNCAAPHKLDRILIIDDNHAIHEDIRKILNDRKENYKTLDSTKALLFGDEIPKYEQARFEIDSAFQGQEGLEKVNQASEAGRPYALAFVDIRMPPGWDGIETISHLWKTHPDLQVVICSAYSDYSWTEMIRQIGKTDNLVILKKPFENIELLQLAHALTGKWNLHHQVKRRLHDLDQAVSQRTTELQATNERLKQEIDERMQVEKALRVSEERFSKAFQASPIPMAIRTLRQEIYVDANPGFLSLTGFDYAELIGHTAQELSLWDDIVENSAMLEKLQQQMVVRSLPCHLRTKSGKVRNVLMSVELFDFEGEPLLLIITQDITDQMLLEDKLRQAQKMEAVGQLAAGVAHDFNNVLTVIQGHSSLLLYNKPPEASDRKPIEAIAVAADRAAKLVRQLLTFSRKQFAKMSPMSIDMTLASISEMLQRLLPENITLIINNPSGLPYINADPGMIEQLIMNLAVNARDAMPDGGRLTISVKLTEMTPGLSGRNQDARPGQFLCLSVADTGCGMTPEVQAHIFEPFFTTKPVGKGTGLGLATVYGIAKQHEAWVEVETQPGQGSCFFIFFPTCAMEIKHDPITLVLPVSSIDRVTFRGNETIFVVEDELAVREFVVSLLRSYGYQVVEAESGPQALECWAKHNGKVHLLLTDIMMPGGMTGRDLGVLLAAQDPALKIIYSSGYSPGMNESASGTLQERYFLPKPYSPEKLLSLLRQCLDDNSAN